MNLDRLCCEKCATYRHAVAEDHIGFRCGECGSTVWTDIEVDEDGLSQSSLLVTEMFCVHGVADSYAKSVIEKGLGLTSDTHPRPFSGAALHSLSQDSLVLHRSVATLCLSGWVAASPLLLRAQFEMLMNSSIIWNDDDPEFMGFKYQYFYLVDGYRDHTSSRETKRNAKTQINAGIGGLPQVLRDRARDFAYKSKQQLYWYRPEISGPTDAIEKYGREGIADTYRYLSSSAHGGFLGMRLFRDEPNRVSASERVDPASCASAIGITSVLTMDQYHLRALVDETVCSDEFDVLRNVVIDFCRKAEANWQV